MSGLFHIHSFIWNSVLLCNYKRQNKVGHRAADTRHLKYDTSHFLHRSIQNAQVCHLNIKCSVSKKEFHSDKFKPTKSRVDAPNDQDIFDSIYTKIIRKRKYVRFVDTQIDMIGNFMSKLIKLVLTFWLFSIVLLFNFFLFLFNFSQFISHFFRSSNISVGRRCACVVLKQSNLPLPTYRALCEFRQKCWGCKSN